MNEIAIRCVVSGRVQGVFYRASARSKAQELGVIGWAKNLDDGRVEVVAIGESPAITELTAWLWQGSPSARVEAVSIEEWAGQRPSDFSVA